MSVWKLGKASKPRHYRSYLGECGGEDVHVRGGAGAITCVNKAYRVCMWYGPRLVFLFSKRSAAFGLGF